MGRFVTASLFKTVSHVEITARPGEGKGIKTGRLRNWHEHEIKTDRVLKFKSILTPSYDVMEIVLGTSTQDIYRVATEYGSRQTKISDRD